MIDGGVDLLESSERYRQQLEAGCSPEERKRKGQYFTPSPICRFMASLFSKPGKDFRLLDPGAGVGSLTAAVCARWAQWTSPRRLEVHLFENDPAAVNLLEKNMEACRRSMRAAGHQLKCVVHATDFIAAVGEEFNRPRALFREVNDLGHFDGVIMNPPYFKTGKDSASARLMASIVHGQPNVYAFFLALATHVLRPGGELIAITPRSFCNGLYFRGFRKWFLQRMSLEHLHVFESRTETFQRAGVLQENIVLLARRTSDQSPAVRVSTSKNGEIDKPRHRLISAASVIDSSSRDNLLRIPLSELDQSVQQSVESLPTTFSETGLRVSTGPVVLFRAKEFLTHDGDGDGMVPLLLPHNVKPFETVWPVQKHQKPVGFKVCPASRRLLLPAKNYVLLKRFSAKEEPRRLIAGCFLGSRQKWPNVAVENHLNYIYHGTRELSDSEVFGVAALLNSRLYDAYFRLLSGSTQVNATELRLIRFPTLKTIAALGRAIRPLLPASEETLEPIVVKTLVGPQAVFATVGGNLNG